MIKPRAILFASTALVAIGAAADLALDAAARNAARQHLATMGVEADSILAHARTGKIVVTGARLNAGGASAHIGKLRLRAGPMSLSLVSPAHALDASVTATDISIVAPFATYKIPSIEAQGANLSSADLAALFDAKAPTPIAERLAKLNAAAILAPEMIVETKIGAQTQRAVYKAIKLSNVVAGKVAETSVAGATTEANQTESGEMRGIYGPMRITNLDLPLIARLITEKAKPGEQRGVAYSDFTLDGARITASRNNLDAQIGKITGKDVKVRPLKEGLQALFEIAAESEKSKKDPNAPSVDRKRAGAIVADVFDAFEIGSAEAVGILFKAMDKDKRPVALTLSRIGMAGFGGGPRFGEISYDGFKINAPDGIFSIGGIALRGLDLSNLMEAVATGDEKALEKNPRAALPTLSQFVVKDIDIDANVKDGSGNADDGKRGKAQLGKFEYNGSGYILGIPIKSSLALERLVFDLPPNVKDPQLRELAALGLKRIDVTSRISVAWDEAKKELALTEASFVGDRLGAIKLSLLAGNVEKELFSTNAAAAQAAVLGAVLKKLDLSVSDTGLLGLVLAMDAKGKGKPIDQLRSDYVAAAAIGIPAMLGNHPSAKALGAAVSKFLAQPQNLKITATAKDGIGAADLAIMQNPADLLSKIELQATAGQ